MAIYKGNSQIGHVYYRGTEYTSIYLGDLTIFSPSVIVYGITCDLENVTSNAPASVNSGSPLSVVLTGVNGNKVQENSVIVTMGGNDITTTAYNHATKTISIARVTGNVSIKAVGRPYDAEVEWLQSDGSAYINTGIKTSSNIKVDADIKVLSTFTGDSCAIFGGRIANNNTALTLQYYKTSSRTSKYWRFSYGNVYELVDHNGTMGDFHISSIASANTMVITGAGSYTTTCSNATFSNNYDIFIFGMNSGGEHGGKGAIAHIQYKAFKIYNNPSLVRDFIPVRDNGIGYLYDKVSGQLFGNANNSGAFTYGNDV